MVSDSKTVSGSTVGQLLQCEIKRVGPKQFSEVWHIATLLLSNTVQFKAKKVLNSELEIILKDQLLLPNIFDSPQILKLVAMNGEISKLMASLKFCDGVQSHHDSYGIMRSLLHSSFCFQISIHLCKIYFHIEVGRYTINKTLWLCCTSFLRTSGTFFVI